MKTVKYYEYNISDDELCMIILSHIKMKSPAPFGLDDAKIVFKEEDGKYLVIVSKEVVQETK